MPILLNLSSLALKVTSVGLLRQNPAKPARLGEEQRSPALLPPIRVA